MSQQFIVPTIFNTFLGIWYYVLMAEFDELQSVPLHVFCVLARVFYGMCVSFPFDPIVQTTLSRMILWISIFITTLDALQLVSIIQQFNSYTLVDSLAILFGAFFLISDLLFVLQLYRHSVATRMDFRDYKGKEEEEEKEDTQTEPEVIVEESLNDELDGLRRRNHSTIKF